MSISERVVGTRVAKWVVIITGLVPAAVLVWDVWRRQSGADDAHLAIHTTGMTGLVLITLSLVITPLRALTGWNTLIAVRRNLGVLGFLYVAAHFTIFFLLERDGSVAGTLTEIGKRQYLWFGAGALILMGPLALTSTDGMVTRLGGRRWKRLHRLAYLIVIGAVIHYYLLTRADRSDVGLPIAFAAAVGALLGYRVVAHYASLRAEVHAARQRVASGPRKVAKRKFWSGELTIARIFDETHDVKTFRLASPDGGTVPFDHVAGQYLNLVLSIAGKRVNRSYTIASSPTRNAYCEISVKRAADGYGSRHLHETWREGQRVKVSAPAGKFVFTGTEAERVVLIAGGIGITPMMSVVRSLTDRGWRGDIFLLFSVKAVRDVIFREELAYLQNRFPNLRVRVVVSRDPETAWDGPRGQVTRDVIAGFIPNLTRGPILLCGPAPMMTAVRDILIGMGVPDSEVLQEKFVSRPEVDTPTGAFASPAVEDPLADGVSASIVFKRAGKTAELPREQTVLEAAEEAGVEIPFECRSGICGQCKTRLLAGRVTMAVQDALTAVDRARGLILACQAHALRDVEVDA
jgi:ferredoxin-NADP reductase/DMSO/TMAO reductase YedYZ heme-binding membrane subunit